jgi:hypothetical protein
VGLQRGVHVTIDNTQVLEQWPDLFAGRQVWWGLVRPLGVR